MLRKAASPALHTLKTVPRNGVRHGLRQEEKPCP
jgi:hypothetical protein